MRMMLGGRLGAGGLRCLEDWRSRLRRIGYGWECGYLKGRMADGARLGMKFGDEKSCSILSRTLRDK